MKQLMQFFIMLLFFGIPTVEAAEILKTTEQNQNFTRYLYKNTAKEDAEQNLLNIQGSAYYLPLGEGKYVPAQNDSWVNYLAGKEFSVIEQFSMAFVAAEQGEKALVYIFENPYRTFVEFSKNNPLEITVKGTFETIDGIMENSIRVYETVNNPVAIAEIYKNYVEEKGKILTLEEKGQSNPNILKLFGAPHIYFWSDRVIAPEDINWQAFRKALSTEAFSYVKKSIASLDESKEILNVLEALSKQDYADNYQKQLICRGLSQILQNENFANATYLSEKDKKIIEKINQSQELNPKEVREVNKEFLFALLPQVFKPVESWNASATTNVLADMKKSGIEKAWIGLNDWNQGFNTPEMIQFALEQGYLIGPYDSYHSIHAPGQEQWITAAFPDATLYEQGTVTGKDGKKLTGFQQVGRKLNPTLSLPYVKERVQFLMDTGIGFNSWFIDCDATGEIHDDYSPQHMTPSSEDLKARLQRMNFIATEYNTVIGSEGGHDFAVNTIAFAHGIELQSFSWQDKDMGRNKESEYYLGRYYSTTGGVPEKFAKPVPIKDKFIPIFFDMSYEVPLYKLVYNNSIITTYHWDWSTFKIPSQTENRMLREVLYNVPPLYHLDKAEWEKYKEKIIAHQKIWAPFHEKAIKENMTDFKYLSPDRKVQLTAYGKNLSVVANFSEKEFIYKDVKIPPLSLLISDLGKTQIYTP